MDWLFYLLTIHNILSGLCSGSRGFFLSRNSSIIEARLLSSETTRPSFITIKALKFQPQIVVLRLKLNRSRKIRCHGAGSQIYEWWFRRPYIDPDRQGNPVTPGQDFFGYRLIEQEAFHNVEIVKNLYIGCHLRGETKLLQIISPGLIRGYLVKGFCCFIKYIKWRLSLSGWGAERLWKHCCQGEHECWDASPANKRGSSSTGIVW